MRGNRAWLDSGFFVEASYQRTKDRRLRRSRQIDRAAFSVSVDGDRGRLFGKVGETGQHLGFFRLQNFVVRDRGLQRLSLQRNFGHDRRPIELSRTQAKDIVQTSGERSIEPLAVLVNFRGERRHNSGAAILHEVSNRRRAVFVHHVVGGDDQQFVIERAVADVDECDIDVVFEKRLDRVHHLIVIRRRKIVPR